MGGLGSSSPPPTQRCFCHETFKTAGVRAGDMMECGNMELPEPFGHQNIATGFCTSNSALEKALIKFSMLSDHWWEFCILFWGPFKTRIYLPWDKESTLAKFLLKCWWVVWWPAHQNHCHETVNTPCGSHVWNVGDVADSKVIEY